MKVAYLVSRFPTATETFIVRELNAVAEAGGVELELYSLYPPSEPFVHPSARRWTERPHRPSPADAVAALGWWLLRRPLRLTSTVAAVVAGHARHPGVLGRALVTVPLAAEHARRVRHAEIEHVHAHFATYPALAAWVCHRLTGVSYSFTAHAHDIFIDHERSFLARKLRDARFVVVISDFNRRYLDAWIGGAETPIHVVHCGIAPAAYAFRPRDPPAEGPVRAVCVATLEEHKGHDVLFRALALGDDRLARIELDLVGGRDPEPLRRLADDLGIAARVRFHGRLAEDEVAALLDRADLFVLPSRVARNGQMEGIPVALMEALAAGLRVVASRLSGIPELVREGETGHLAEPGDPAALAAALARALAGEVDPRAGRALVEREFESGASGRRMVELFRS